MKTALQRWEDGDDHDPRSVEMAKALARLGEMDVFDFRFGGDGDGGEELMYLMDMYFETKGSK